MHVIPPHQTAVTLFGRDGSVRLFQTRKCALRALGTSFIRGSIGPSFNAPAPGRGGCDPRFTAYDAHFVPLCDHVLLDDSGRALDISDFHDLILHRLSVWRRSFGEYGVKHPGRRRSAYRHWLRYPRTTAERRQNCLVIQEDGEPPIRGRRSAAMLPNAWDDVYRRQERGWKSQRKTQHRAGGERHAHSRNGGPK